MRDLIHTQQFEGFEIKLYAIPEDEDPRGCFASGDDAADQEIIDKINSGEYAWFCACVTASREGIELASTYLGCCCYEYAGSFVTESGYFEDMRAEVITEARATIAKLCMGVSA